jgi:hypothetical protein
MKQTNVYWFKAKKYGYGWYPATWQGWMVILIYLLILGILIAIFESNIEKYLLFYFVSVFIITALLIFISYKKGEKAKWRWGNDK